MLWADSEGRNTTQSGGPSEVHGSMSSTDNGISYPSQLQIGSEHGTAHSDTAYSYHPLPYLCDSTTLSVRPQCMDRFVCWVSDTYIPILAGQGSKSDQTLSWILSLVLVRAHTFAHIQPTSNVLWMSESLLKTFAPAKWCWTYRSLSHRVCQPYAMTLTPTYGIKFTTKKTRDQKNFSDQKRAGGRSNVATTSPVPPLLEKHRKNMCSPKTLRQWQTRGTMQHILMTLQSCRQLYMFNSSNSIVKYKIWKWWYTW